MTASWRNRWGAYKGSTKWYHLKDRAMQRDNCRCSSEVHEFAHEKAPTENLEMHHDSYPDTPEHDAIDNVRILCRDCHETFHYHKRLESHGE